VNTLLKSHTPLPGYARLKLRAAATIWAFSLGLAAPAHAEDAPIFSVRLSVEISEEATPRSTASLTLRGGEDKQQQAKLEISPRLLHLTDISNEKQETLWQQRVDLSPGRHELILKQRPGRFAVCLDGSEVGAADLLLPGRITCQFTDGEGLVADARPRVQRVGAIRFDDDFARANEGDELWKTLSGRFALNTSLNPGSSQSAFQLWGSSPRGEGMILANQSYWFWDDYELGVSIKCQETPACVGLVLHYLGPGDYHLVRWSQPIVGGGNIQLVRRRRNVPEHVLAQSPCTLVPGQWYRLTAATFGPHARVFMGGTELFNTQDASLIGGKLGLYLSGTAGTHFDDLAVTSTDQGIVATDWRPAAPFGPCEQMWADFSNKQFAGDKFMMQWAHPRSFWEQPEGQTHWFRTRFFHDVRFSWKQRKRVPTHWPGKPVKVVLFGDPTAPNRGYRLLLTKDRVALERDGKEVASGVFAGEKLNRIAADVDEGQVRFWVNDALVLTWRDQEPITHGFVGADVGRTWRGSRGRGDWRDDARLESTHRLDYGFDAAPAAWEAQSGDWRGTHRWACVPKWSFFGGRGRSGSPGTEHSNAVLWNLRRFTGDFDLEVSFAPMEGTPQRIHFSYPVTLNVAFAADGRRLGSGYMLLFGTYDLPTRLFRQGKEVGTFAKRVNTELRNDPIPWYRHVTRVWQQVRIQRRDGRIRVDVAKHDDQASWAGFEQVFDLPETEPLIGDRIGFWTWGPNGMAISRVTMSFAESPGAAPVGGGRTASSKDGVARELLNGNDGEPPLYTRITNCESGGPFCHDLIRTPVDLTEQGTLAFDLRPGPNVSLALLVSVRGQTAEVDLTDAALYRPHRISLDSSPATPEAWTTLCVDLAAALRRVFPDGDLVADRVCIASPYARVAEIAGLDLNATGAWFDLANVDWRASEGPGGEEQPPPALAVWLGKKRLNCDFEADYAGMGSLGGPDGALLARDFHEPFAGQASLRLVNQRVAGPAGFWLSRTPFDAARLPRLSFAYRVPKGVELNLVAEANGRWFEIQLSGNDASWPVIHRDHTFATDGQWHQAQYDIHSLLKRFLRTDNVQVDRLALADTQRMSTWQDWAYWIDDVRHSPAVTSGAPGTLRFSLVGGDSPSAMALVIDDAPDTDPGKTPNHSGNRLDLTPKMGGRTLHVRACTADGTWTPPVHIPILKGGPSPAKTAPIAAAEQTTPPPAPFISYIPSRRLCRMGFEWQQSPDFPEREYQEAGIRREAWLLRQEGDGATGRGCTELVNLSPNGFFSGYLHRGRWDVDAWPCISFDYKFEQPGCALNLSLLVNEAMTIVEWTGPNAHGNYFHDGIVGKTPRAKQDGQWHHTNINLLDMLVTGRFPGDRARGQLTAGELATWATSHTGRGAYVNPGGARLKLDNITIHSPRDRTPSFEWRVHGYDEELLGGYSYVFDENPETVPSQTINTEATQARLHDISPGQWFFHVRAADTEGKWGETAHLAVELSD
jgi:hypothetical protein